MLVSCSLVIGSTGFIGKSLCKSLDEEHTYTVSRKKSSNTYKSSHFLIDIRNDEKVEKILKKLYKKYEHINIFFLAGESSVESSLSNPEKSFFYSLKSFITIISKLKKNKTTIIIASSGAIYDSRKKKCFDEKDSLYPPSSYAASKFAIEGLALAHHESFGIDIRVARIFSVFGEDMERFFIFDLIKKLKSSKKKITLRGSGNQERDYLHVKDVVQGLILILKKGKAGEIYNICSGKPIKLKFLAERVKKILNKKNIKIAWNKEKSPGIRESWYGKNNKIKKLGFKIKNFDESLSKSVIEINSKLKRK